MRRREFIKLVGGAAAAWPLSARAQQAHKLARIGFLGAASATGFANQLRAFRQGLADLGYIEGATIVIEYRWADDKIATGGRARSVQRGRDRHSRDAGHPCREAGYGNDPYRDGVER
ncbi:MAG: hypothetical protein WAV78_34450 [Xanthobacteraceae bacterium]